MSQDQPENAFYRFVKGLAIACLVFAVVDDGFREDEGTMTAAPGPMILKRPPFLIFRASLPALVNRGGE